MQKIVKTSNDVLSGFENKNHVKFGLSIVNDGSAKRFFILDSEKFGKLSHSVGSYSQGLTITEDDVYKNNPVIQHINVIDNLMAGGFYIGLDTNNTSLQNLPTLISKSMDVLPYFNIFNKHVVCCNCGAKVSGDRFCSVCNSNNLLVL
jgi:ribonucleoside-triphosphate reductase